MNRFERIAKMIVANDAADAFEQLHYDIEKVFQDYRSDQIDDTMAQKLAVSICKSFVQNNKNVKPMATKWGFDKIHFRTAENFAKVLAVGGVSVLQEPKRGRIGEFIWNGTGVEIVCYNNPITGEYATPNRKTNEIGYGGYMGIEGNPDKVDAVVKMVKRYGKFEDESPNARDFI